MSKIKKKPDFSVILDCPLEINGSRAVLSRYSNDGTRLVREHFILDEVLGGGTFGQVYRSLGVEQQDKDGHLIVDKIDQPLLKKATRGGGFERVIKVFLSAEETFKKEVKKNYPSLSNDEIENCWQENKEQFVAGYEQDIKMYAANTYENGELASKSLTKDPQTGKYYLVMHAVKGMDLEKYVKTETGSYIEPQKKIKIGVNIAIELEKIGNRRVIHNDFKPLNLIIDPDSHAVRAVDFDSSKKIAEGEEDVESESGTLLYFPPERFSDDARSTKKSDVFSATASIIDAMTGYAYQRSYNELLCQAKKGKNFNKSSFDFGYYGHPQYGKEYPRFLDVSLSVASSHRMQVLQLEIAHPDYLLSNETKKEFLQLCARGLSIDPQVRPTQSELTAGLKKVQLELEHNLQEKRISSLKESAKINLTNYLAKLDLVFLWKNFKTIDTIFKEFINNIAQYKTSSEIEQSIEKAMTDIRNICVFNYLPSLNKEAPESEGSVSAYVNISEQYESYKNTLDKASEFCSDAATHYAKKQEKIQKQYGLVSNEIKTEREYKERYLTELAKNHFSNLASNQPASLESLEACLKHLPAQLKNSSIKCQKSYKKHVVDNPECAKTARDKVIVKAGVAIFNGLACITGLAFIASVGSFIYNQVNKRKDAPVQTLIQPLASTHHRQIKRRYDEFSNLFKPNEQAPDKTPQTKQQKQVYPALSKVSGG